MFSMQFDTDNAAFDDDNGGRTEIARILQDTARAIESGQVTVTLRDINGNHVGQADYNPFKSA